MIRLRAGILYNIANSILKKQHISEIFYWSNNPKYILSMQMINDILEIDKDINYIPPVDFDYEHYFEDFSVLKYLDDVSINVLAYYFLEYCKFEKIENPILQWKTNTRGQAEEKAAIYRFNNVYGYTINPIKRSEYKIPNTNIIISGTPDGIIMSSPGGIFDGYLVEIKYQTKINNDRNKFQIASYCKIFNKPVMLIIYSVNKYKIFHYTVETLNRMWNKYVLPGLLKNIEIIKENVIIKKPQDIIKYQEYLKSFSI